MRDVMEMENGVGDTKLKEAEVVEEGKHGCKRESKMIKNVNERFNKEM